MSHKIERRKKTMSKIKKAAAVVAASVLCMSMSLGVFASSPTDPEQLTPEEQEMRFLQA